MRQVHGRNALACARWTVDQIPGCAVVVQIRGSAQRRRRAARRLGGRGISHCPALADEQLHSAPYQTVPVRWLVVGP